MKLLLDFLNSFHTEWGFIKHPLRVVGFVVFMIERIGKPLFYWYYFANPTITVRNLLFEGRSSVGGWRRAFFLSIEFRSRNSNLGLYFAEEWKVERVIDQPNHYWKLGVPLPGWFDEDWVVGIGSCFGSYINLKNFKFLN